MQPFGTLDLTDSYIIHDVPIYCHGHPTQPDGMNACVKAIETALTAFELPDYAGIHPFLMRCSGPVFAGEKLDNALFLGRAFEIESGALLCEHTGSAGVNFVQDIQADGLSILTNKPTVAGGAASGAVTMAKTDFSQTVFTGSEKLTFPIDSAPAGAEDVTLILWIKT